MEKLFSLMNISSELVQIKPLFLKNQSVNAAIELFFLPLLTLFLLRGALLGPNNLKQSGISTVL